MGDLDKATNGTTTTIEDNTLLVFERVSVGSFSTIGVVFIITNSGRKDGRLLLIGKDWGCTKDA